MNRITIAGLGIFVLAAAGGAAFLAVPARDGASAATTRAAPPPSPSAPLAATGTTRMTVVESGAATFLIDAPLEKIKGRSGKYRGALDVDARDLKKTKGEIDLDLDDLVTQTFDDADKNAAQTEHAHNWLGLGADVPAAARDENRWARFTIIGIDEASPAALADAPEAPGGRAVKIIARGDMWLHGVSSPKTVKLTAIFTGPASAPTSVRLTTDAPVLVSLKEHDVKPRDLAGRFLNGALEKVGKKIDDRVQVSLEVTATAATLASTR